MLIRLDTTSTTADLRLSQAAWAVHFGSGLDSFESDHIKGKIRIPMLCSIFADILIDRYPKPPGPGPSQLEAESILILFQSRFRFEHRLF